MSRKNLGSRESGIISVSVVTSVVFGILVLVFGSIMIWALVNYNDQKNNVSGKIEAAVEKAKKEQSDKDQEIFDEKEKDPLTEFKGPSDLGRVTFSFPKTWSVYIDDDGSSSGEYSAFFNPGAVASVQDNNNKYALRLEIVSRSYDQVLQQYATATAKGDLNSEAITVNGFSGQEFKGKFSSDLEGAVAVFKIRDKTLILHTDTPDSVPDFDDKVLKTLKFDQ